MNYEKAYKDALNEATIAYKDEDKHLKVTLERIFPVLKETEDEKIRKWIIDDIRYNMNNEPLNNSEYKKEAEKAIAWLEKQGNLMKALQISNAKIGELIEKNYYLKEQLEKQGEQKLIDKIQLGKMYKCIASPRYSTFMKGLIYVPQDKFLCSLMNFCSDCFEPIEDGEQKPVDKAEPKFKKGDVIRRKDGDGLEWTVEEVHKDGYYNIVNSDRDDFVYLDDNWELVEQKHAWSEEDDIMVHDIDSALRCQITYPISKLQSMSAWILNLKNRVLPQPKQEWSEEDKKILDFIIFHLQHAGGIMYQKEINWLKSLKDKVQPKPKDEWDEEDCNQIETIACHLDNIGNGAMAELLLNIMNKYKSLRPQNWTKEDKERYISCLQRLGTGNPEQPETINSKWFKEHVYPQNTWKPSDEQMDTLEHYMQTLICTKYKESLFGLYLDLKKLKE